MPSKIYNLLLYLTNNEKHSRDEILFDSIFFVVNTLALLIGIWALIYEDEPAWIAFLIIEYVWALDNMRHNR